MTRVFGRSDIAIILLTFTLFFFALFLKGFTKDLLLEIGVFLVSVKLIMSSYKNTLYAQTILNELENIKQALGETNRQSNR